MIYGGNVSMAWLYYVSLDVDIITVQFNSDPTLLIGRQSKRQQNATIKQAHQSNCLLLTKVYISDLYIHNIVDIFLI